MTKEKILSVFEDINVMYNNPNMYDVLSKMLDKLVEDSKKSAEYETDEDCISRERVLLEINRIGFDAFTSYDYYSNLYDFINSLSSEEPKKKRGKWIGEEPWCLPKCSVCGASCFGLHGFDAIKTPYCPTCGSYNGG